MTVMKVIEDSRRLKLDYKLVWTQTEVSVYTDNYLSAFFYNFATFPTLNETTTTSETFPTARMSSSGVNATDEETIIIGIVGYRKFMFETYVTYDMWKGTG